MVFSFYYDSNGKVERRERTDNGSDEIIATDYYFYEDDRLALITHDTSFFTYDIDYHYFYDKDGRLNYVEFDEQQDGIFEGKRTYTYESGLCVEFEPISLNDYWCIQLN